MEISVVIPTYNRPDDLSRCLKSILIQTILPKEVVIVDNADNQRSEKLVKFRIAQFRAKGILLKYIRNERENATTIAKNIGVENSSGYLISFLDDDVILDKEYYQEIIRVFRKYSKALGVMGKTIPVFKRNKLNFLFYQILGRMFFLGFNEKNKCRMLPSLGVTSPLADKITNCQWISGASTYKREVFDRGFRFDEKLIKYAWNEDSDFSHRVYKKYPQSLFVNPQAKYIHTLSKKGRTPEKEIAYMEEVYCLYLFYKLIPQNFKNKLIYVWSRIGRTIFKIVSCLMRKLSFLGIIYSIQAYVYCLKHLKQIKKGDLDFFNKTLK